MQRRGNSTNFILMVICILLTFAVSLGSYMAYDYFSQSDDADKSSLLSAEISSDDSSIEDVDKSDVDTIDKKAMLRRFDFDELQSKVPDFYCWMYIPNTEIDYCVVHIDVNNQKYVWSDVYGDSSSVGCIFTYDTEEDDMLRVFYGHHLSGPAKMFTELTNYENKEWAEEHPYVYLYFPDRVERWKVWAPQYVTKSHAIYQYPYHDGEADYDMLLSNLDTAFGEKFAEKPTMHDKIIALSTCDSAIDGTSGRYVVPLKADISQSYNEVSEN